MLENTQPRQTVLSRVLLAVFFATAGSLLIVVFSPWNPLIQNNVWDYLGRLGAMLFFGILYLMARRIASLTRYSSVVFGLLVLAVVVTLDWVFGLFLIQHIGLRAGSPAQAALAKLNEVFIVAAFIVLFTHCSGAGLGSIYLHKGRLKQGLLIGGACFLVFMIAGIPMATSLFQGKDLSITRALPWLPWLLICVFSNSGLEELMFRGLFLRKLEPFLGKLFSNILIAVVFTLIHYAASYTTDQMMFMLILFPLAILLGYLAQKTDALWASILLHAGMDIPVFLAILSNL